MEKYFKEKDHDLLELRGRLNLPDRISLISNYDLIDFIDKMENEDYRLMLMESFINHKGIARIMRDNPELFCGDPYSFWKTAIKRLRSDIITTYTEKEDLLIKTFIDSKTLNRLEIPNIPVREVIDIIGKMEYHQSKDMDRLILGLFKNGFILDYPLFLLKDSMFPFNLYGDYLGNSGILYKDSVKELYGKYISQIAHTPLYTFRNYNLNSSNLFNSNQKLLNDNQKLIGSLFYQKEMRIPDISRKTGLSESWIKFEIYRIIDILNSDRGKRYIHTGMIA